MKLKNPLYWTKLCYFFVKVLYALYFKLKLTEFNQLGQRRLDYWSNCRRWFYSNSCLLQCTTSTWWLFNNYKFHRLEAWLWWCISWRDHRHRSWRPWFRYGTSILLNQERNLIQSKVSRLYDDSKSFNLLCSAKRKKRYKTL